MSLAGFIAPPRAQNVNPDDYDHAIDLVDATKPVSRTPSTTDAQASADVLARKGSKSSTNPRQTIGTLREELGRRKYAKYQESRYNGGEGTGDVSNGENSDKDVGNGKNKKNPTREGRLRDRVPFRSKKPTKVRKQQQDYEVDILYENQRGSFFCGIPLYSSKSLLNFDPSPWQTADFKDSPVNITNAQVPDPTWAWAWRSWYVDMSHDVDEEGWEYSFSFRQGFSWHGAHPWFHSFVRRRRWLRKRVKIHPHTPHGARSSMKNAHMLNADYFTIHATRDRSRASSVDGTVTNRSSYVSSNYVVSDTDQDNAEVTDIADLFRRLRKATVDRTKVEAIKNFLEHGGEELVYLPDHMDEIMGMFYYQTSRRQLLSELRNICKIKTDDLDEPGVQDDSDEEEKRKADNLLKAVQAADEHVKDLEFWSDKKAVQGKATPGLLQEEDQNGNSGKRGLHVSTETDDNEDSRSHFTENEIKGIPESARVDQAPGINWDLHENESYEPKQSTRTEGKGKEKAKEVMNLDGP
ncbi:hypothetical protein MMC30_006737 [Trapelia coarctata]|nr:hypothetical protein [Trapelia coarctata]